MSGIRHGSRLDQLKALLHTTTVQIEHARRRSHPYGQHLLLAERLRGEIERLEPSARLAASLHETSAPQTARTAAQNARTEYAASLYARHNVTPSAVRAWALEQGLAVKKSRGQLPAAILTAYDAAHQPQETP